MVADGPGGAVMVSPSVTVYKDGTYAIHGGKGLTTWLRSTPGAPAALRGTLRLPQITNTGVDSSRSTNHEPIDTSEPAICLRSLSFLYLIRPPFL